MDINIVRAFFMWCAIINVALLVVWSIFYLCAADLIYRIHSKWFPMPRESYNMAWYFLLGLFKILVIVFNIVPYVALLIIR